MTQVKDVFIFYRDFVKPLYCDIEARDNILPVELLFEIHAAFDHLRRFYADGECEAISVEKAFGHLKRGSLDAFKLKLKYFNEDVERILDQKIDFSLIDSGRFLPRVIVDKDTIQKVAKQARITESQDGHEEAFEYWSRTSTAIDEFYEKYLNDTEKFVWAKRKTFFISIRDNIRNFWLGFVAGIFSSAVVTVGWYWLTKK